MGKGDSDLYNEDDLSWGGIIRRPKRGEILDQMRDADLCEVLVFYLLFIESLICTLFIKEHLKIRNAE